jgi:hypothetical protein
LCAAIAVIGADRVADLFSPENGLFFAFSLSLLPLVGCDKAAPEAPAGSILAVSANPTRIALNGQSIITIIGRQPDGKPLNPGTEIRLSAGMRGRNDRSSTGPWVWLV